jgi:hypothetical protein
LELKVSDRIYGALIEDTKQTWAREDSSGTTSFRVTGLNPVTPAPRISHSRT